MLGLDAVSLPFIHENRRKLPTLDRLLSAGELRHLTSSANHLSASVWPTFSTGAQPGEHGQYFPFQWDARDGRYRRVADRRWSEAYDVTPFWHRIARGGRSTIAFDIAHALHDERAPCLQITNWSYQSSGAAKASNPDVLVDIQRRFGRRPIGPEVPVPKTSSQCAAIQHQLMRAVRAKADATIYLMNRPWQLFVTGWYEAHRAGHNLWPIEGDFASEASPEAMLAVYQETDRQLGRVLEFVQGQDANTSVIIFSLHGMEPNRAQDHFLPEILLRLNRLYLGQSGAPSVMPKSPNAMAYLRKVLPPTLQYRAAALLGERVQDWVVNRALVAGRKWSATPSFPILSGGEGLIRLNVKGRERQGFFSSGSEELPNYLNWLTERLLRVTVSATGQPLIEQIVDVNNELPGPRRQFLPDLILKWAPDEPATAVRSPDIGEIRISLATGRGGNHNGSAFMIAHGDAELIALTDQCEDITDLSGLAENSFGLVAGGAGGCANLTIR